MIADYVNMAKSVLCSVMHRSVGHFKFKPHSTLTASVLGCVKWQNCDGTAAERSGSLACVTTAARRNAAIGLATQAQVAAS